MLLSITGLFKTLLIIIAVIVIIRFLGKLMTAKRNMEEERRLNKQQREHDNERRFSEKNRGKINISKSQDVDAEDVDFEELK